MPEAGGLESRTHAVQSRKTIGIGRVEKPSGAWGTEREERAEATGKRTDSPGDDASEGAATPAAGASQIEQADASVLHGPKSPADQQPAAFSLVLALAAGSYPLLPSLAAPSAAEPLVPLRGGPQGKLALGPSSLPAPAPTDPQTHRVDIDPAEATRIGEVVPLERPPEIVFETTSDVAQGEPRDADSSRLIREFEAHLEREARRHGYL
jgi:hypothetical protein